MKRILSYAILLCVQLPALSQGIELVAPRYHRTGIHTLDLLGGREISSQRQCGQFDFPS